CEIPVEVGAVTINKVCGSGMKAVHLAAQAIKAGDAEVVLAGGMESMTNTPYYLLKARDGYRLGNGEVVDGMVHDGLWDVYNNYHMGNTGELVAEKYGITREMQDEWSAASHQKAAKAQADGKFKAEIAPVHIPRKKLDPIVFDTDEGVRADSTAAGLGKLRPVFKADGGTVTAGNASQLSDGAAALIITSAAKAKALGCEPIARLAGYATGGMAPEWVMMTPVSAVKNLEKKGFDRKKFDLYEFNEAFASQACALPKELELDPAKINVNGGAVALGHPIGCSGARILVTLIHALRDRGLSTGLASLCMGGGNGLASAIEII
ncbi:MAG: acetyl-CoA C-acyltransferase, partial [Planctomycetota bacterium]